MNILDLHAIVVIENEVMRLQSKLQKTKDEQEKDKLKLEIIRLNGKRNDRAAKIGELK